MKSGSCFLSLSDLKNPSSSGLDIIFSGSGKTLFFFEKSIAWKNPNAKKYAKYLIYACVCNLLVGGAGISYTFDTPQKLIWTFLLLPIMTLIRLYNSAKELDIQ